MKCQYCGKELSASDKYCDFCGAKVKTETAKVSMPAEVATTPALETHKSPEGKKKKNPWVIVLIVFLVATLISAVITVAGGFALKFFVDNIDKIVEDIDFDSDFVDGYFDYDDDHEDIFDFDDNNLYGHIKSAEKFKVGTTDASKNTYKSEFGSIDFTLPTFYETYTKSEIAKQYEEYGISKSVYKNNLVVYDFRSENAMTGTTIEVDYYNMDYYDDYKNLDEYNKSVKQENYDLKDAYDCTVEYAEDSVIVLDNNEYSQLAARITIDGVDLYAYNFTRVVDGYFMDISIVAYDINDVGDIITAINGEKK